MLQHAIFTIPNRAEGYTTDDNARALIFTVQLEQAGGEPTGMSGKTGAANPDWAFRYLAFLEHAFNPNEEKVPKLPRLRPPLDWKSRDRKILTAAPCGRWERCWADPQIMD